ncbi:MAG: hypothetical protein OEZ68_16245 [Gammaproteobacteria bacterium]|nr:hypothetical protein [Gammaproteobacteria bacterium]MDH5802354.1 hypothetical protein [Gammaproteobacteria bacterium]
MGDIFTGKFLLVITGVLLLSSAFSYTFIEKKPQSPTSLTLPTEHLSVVSSTQNTDDRIDLALDHSLNGEYHKSFPVLKELADANVTRAKLYLAVAHYHGHGTEKNKQKAKSLLLELQDKNYEPGIVSTYLNLIAYTEQ